MLLLTHEMFHFLLWQIEPCRKTFYTMLKLNLPLENVAEIGEKDGEEESAK